MKVLELQVTHRVTHQLVTRVFAIFLREIFDFKNIQIDNFLDAYIPAMPSEKFAEVAPLMWLSRPKELENNRDLIPSMNLEVWIPPDAHLKFPDAVQEGASLSEDLARYGLFIQESFGTKTYSYKDFRSSSPGYYDTIKDFKLDARMNHTLYLNVDPPDVFTPPQCFSSAEP